MKSTVSDEQIHDGKWISEKEAIKELILRRWFSFVEESIKVYMEFPCGYQVNGKFEIMDKNGERKNGSGSRWMLDNWDDEKINKKFAEICKELDIVIDTKD